MESIIVTLKDRLNRFNILPRTSYKAVLDNEGHSIQEPIDNYHSIVVFNGLFDCISPSTTVAKTIACENYSLKKGGGFRVKFSYKNRAENPTLNINGTGAYPLYYSGHPATKDNTWEADEICFVFFDGERYQASIADKIGNVSAGEEFIRVNGNYVAVADITAILSNDEVVYDIFHSVIERIVEEVLQQNP